MRSLNTAPGAKRLIQSLRSMGYDLSTAIADLVDNSLVAKASEVHVQINAQQGSRPSSVVVADNGNGMDREELPEAMRFGSLQSYSAQDLGKYGLGLKTASLSQCRILTVSSKARSTNGSRPRRAYARWDLNHIDDSNDWTLLLPGTDDFIDWELEALSHPVSERNGTVVLWTGLEEKLPSLSSHDVSFRERNLAKLLKETGDHLRMVFHRFMQGLVRGRRKLHLYLNGDELKPWDPFCSNEATTELEIAEFPVHLITSAGREILGKVELSPCILPREDEFSSPAAWKEASGPRNWNQQQGFYFYRNDRLLQAGGWSRIRAVDEHLKLLRVGVLFSSELDDAFAINITKMRARIPVEIRDHVGAAVSTWVKLARERYDKKPPRKVAPVAPRGKTNGSATKRSEAPPSVNIGPISFTLSNAPSHSLTVTSSTAGQVRVIVPQSHEFAEIFDVAGEENEDLKRLCLAMLSLIEAVYEKRMKPEAIPIQALKRAFSRFK